MIILSQDREILINFNNVENIWINNPLENNDGLFEIRAETYSDNIVIGKYDTKEKAIEILEEIANYFGTNCLKDMKLQEMDIMLKLKKAAIYYMPEK